MSVCKPLVIAGLLTLVPTTCTYAIEVCPVPDKTKYEDLKALQSDFKSRHANYITENTGKAIFDESDLAEQTHQSYFSPDEEPDGFSSLFPDVSEELGRIGESITTSNTETAEILADNILNSSLETVGADASEALGPVGEIVAVGLWGEGIISTFENQSSTNFDKASSVLSIIPVVGDILGAIKEPVDRKILDERAHRIQHSGYPFDRQNPELNDYNQDRERWERLASNFDQFFIPILAKSVIEDVTLEMEHVYQTAVKAHNQSLAHMFSKIDYEYFKSNQADIIKHQSGEQVRVHGNLDKICSTHAIDSINRINCIKDKVYLERLEELTRFIESRSYNEIAAQNATYASLRKRAVDQSLENLQNIRQGLKEKIRTLSVARWNKVVASNWFRNIGNMLYENTYIPAFHEFANNQLNRVPTQTEINEGRLTIKEPRESCTGTVLIYCRDVPGEYRSFNDHADSRLKYSVNAVNNIRNQNHLNQLMQIQIDSYLPNLLSGEALSAGLGELDKRPTWFSMVDLMVANYQEQLNGPRQAMNQIKSSIQNIMQSNPNGSWSRGYIETQGFTSTEAASIAIGNIEVNLVWRFKEFIDKESQNNINQPGSTLGNARYRIITSVQALYTQDFINNYNAYLQFVRYPFLSPFPTYALLDQEAPELVSLVQSQATKNELSSNEKRKQIFDKIREVYQSNKIDHNLLQSKLGELVRVQQFVNVVDNAQSNNPNGLFFQDQLSDEYLAWSKDTIVSDAKDSAGEIESLLSTRNLKTLKSGFDTLTVTDSSICTVNTYFNERSVNHFKNVSWDKYIYMPYMYQQIQELFAYADQVIELIKNKKTSVCS